MKRGSSSAGMARRMICRFSGPGIVQGSDLRPSLRAVKNQVTIRARPRKMPGTRPPMNIRLMEAPLTTPKRMNPILGGMMLAMMPEEITIPVERLLLYPRSLIMGISTPPRAAVSARALPLRPAKIMLARMET